MGRTIALVGNPNVGKSSLFNTLTGMHQHTGNWSGKTVELSFGKLKSDPETNLVDLPGTYSLDALSPEEEITRDFVEKGEYSFLLFVCDSVLFERNLTLLLQVLSVTKKVIVCLNLSDEAERKGVEINARKLSSLIGVPVIKTSARKRKSIKKLLVAINEFSEPSEMTPLPDRKTLIYETLISKNTYKKGFIDKILTGKITAYPAMLLMLGVVFWITISGANYPSELLSQGFLWIEKEIYEILLETRIPQFLTELLCFGVLRVLGKVVSVMLPPMAIFFPLFTLMEDAGVLPRIAYNLDKPFEKCKACGKQALCMSMGLGCNAVGVVGCRIISSKRERNLAILTNALVPCNGRFPAIITLITLFFVGSLGGASKTLLSAALLLGVVVLGVIGTFFLTKFLSLTFLKGAPSPFILELPPYRRPEIMKTLARSFLDRTIYVLMRAVVVAVPAGAVIFLLSSITVGGESLLLQLASVLDPLGRALGLDGVILLSFILGTPANEIVLPLCLMAYSSSGILNETGIAETFSLLSDAGWNGFTAVSFIIFSLMHWACATTLLTIKKETGSMKLTILSAVLPAAMGIILCFVLNLCNPR